MLSRSASAIRSPKRSSPRPCCRAPKNSPTPRSRTSSSASAKPSRVRSERPQPLPPLVGGRLGEQVTLAGRRSPAHPAAQLVQLRQAEPLRVLHHQQRRVGHVHADLDHRRADQQVDLAGRGIAAITSAFSASSMPAVQQPDAEIAERPRLQFLVRLRRRLHVQRRRFLHQRADDIRLPPRRQALAQLLVDALALVRPPPSA